MSNMLPPISIAPDIKATIDYAMEKSGASQAVVVRQGLRFGIGRYLEAVAAAEEKPSTIRELARQFPPLTMPVNWKAELKNKLARKYAA